MRLSKETIREILTAYSQGQTKSAIATTHQVDVSTVRYHIDAFERTYGSTGAVYALVRPIQRECNHPSLKCLVCGQAQDSIRRREAEEIERLTVKLNEVQSALARYQDVAPPNVEMPVV